MDVSVGFDQRCSSIHAPINGFQNLVLGTLESEKFSTLNMSRCKDEEIHSTIGRLGQHGWMARWRIVRFAPAQESREHGRPTMNPLVCRPGFRQDKSVFL